MTGIIYFEAVDARENIAGAALLCVVFLHLQAEKSGEHISIAMLKRFYLRYNHSRLIIKILSNSLYIYHGLLQLFSTRITSEVDHALERCDVNCPVKSLQRSFTIHLSLSQFRTQIQNIFVKSIAPWSLDHTKQIDRMRNWMNLLTMYDSRLSDRGLQLSTLKGLLQLKQ